MQVVHAQSVVLEWKLFPRRGASSVGQNQQDSPLPLPRWVSATVHIDNPQISYTTKVTTPHPATPIGMLTTIETHLGLVDCQDERWDS